MSNENFPDAVQVNPYGQKELVPVEMFLPDSAIFVAEATVSYEAIGATESYWLQIGHTNSEKCTLWCLSDQLLDEYFCCALMDGSDDDGAPDLAETMLRAFLFSRAPYATSLVEFTSSGLVTRKCLDRILDSYHRALEPRRVEKDAQVEIQELYYENGEIRYRGEQADGLAHGKGIGFWKNGNVWCEGFFKNNQPHGQCRIYYPGGTLRHVGNFKDGYPEGRGKEYFDNGQLWFEGIFGKQTIRYGWRARIWIRGKLYDREGRLLHDGSFITSGGHSKPAPKDTDKEISPIEKLFSGKVGPLPIDND